jgi:hypothetical protein
MREQEIEDSLRESFLDTHESTPKEATSYAHGVVLDLLSSPADTIDPDLDALDDFPDLLDSVEETLDFKGRVVQ